MEALVENMYFCMFGVKNLPQCLEVVDFIACLGHAKKR